MHFERCFFECSPSFDEGLINRWCLAFRRFLVAAKQRQRAAKAWTPTSTYGFSIRGAGKVLALAFALEQVGLCDVTTCVNRQPLEGAGKLPESGAEAWLPRPEG